MSWSVFATGRPAPVMATCADQFEKAKVQCASNVHEVASITAAEALVMNELKFNFDSNAPAVVVEARGSAWAHTNENGTQGSSQVHVKVEPIAGFLKD